MKILVLFTLLTCGHAMSQPLALQEEASQEELVLQDLEQIESHGKKWHAKLKKATTSVKSTAIRTVQNEG